MAVFRRKVTAADFGAAPVKAAAGASVGIGSMFTYSTSLAEVNAMQVPVITRSHDMIQSAIMAMPLRQYRRDWAGDEYQKTFLPNEGWMDQPDPKVTREFFMGHIFSDLYLHGRAFAFVTARYVSGPLAGYPAALTWLPHADINTPDQVGPIWYGKSETIMWQGRQLDPANVVQWISPIMGVLYAGSKAIEISQSLDSYARRLASLETVPGYLQQKNGDDLGGEDLTAIAQAWQAARKANAIGALNTMIEFVEFDNPQEVVADQRKYQALEMSRITGVPPWLLGIEVGGLTYQNAEDARKQLYLFAVLPYVNVMQSELSSDMMLPPGRHVEFTADNFLMADQGAMAPAPTPEVPQ